MATPINKANVSSGAKNLAVMCQEVLDKVVAAYATYTMPVPTRQYWTMGQPTVDCEQLVVSFVQMYVGAPGDEATEPRRCSDPRSATINISVSRQVPVVGVNGRPPSASDIEDYAEISAYDAYILLDCASSLDTWDDGFGLGVIATVEVQTPEGGFQTAVATLTLAVP